MKTLTNYLVEAELKSKYVAIIYDADTQEKLRNYCDKNGFDLSKDYDGNEQNPEDWEFHTTIFYTTSKHDLENREIPVEGSKSVEPISFEMLGHNNDIPVIKVMSDDIKELRNFYENEYGMEDEWPDWKPHISLTYNYSGTDISDTIELPDFSLMFDKIVIKDGKTDE